MTFSLITAFNRRRRQGTAQLSLLNGCDTVGVTWKRPLCPQNTSEKNNKYLRFYPPALSAAAWLHRRILLYNFESSWRQTHFLCFLAKVYTLSCDSWQPSSFLHRQNQHLNTGASKTFGANGTEFAGLMGLRMNVQSSLFATNSNAAACMAKSNRHTCLQRANVSWILLLARFGIGKVAEACGASLIKSHGVWFSSTYCWENKLQTNAPMNWLPWTNIIRCDVLKYSRHIHDKRWWRHITSLFKYICKLFQIEIQLLHPFSDDLTKKRQLSHLMSIGGVERQSLGF